VLDSIAIGAPQQRPERVGIFISIGRVPRLDGIDIQVIESFVEDGLVSSLSISRRQKDMTPE
jgi:hypothetical protein